MPVEVRTLLCETSLGATVFNAYANRRAALCAAFNAANEHAKRLRHADEAFLHVPVDEDIYEIRRDGPAGYTVVSVWHRGFNESASAERWIVQSHEMVQPGQVDTSSPRFQAFAP